MLSCLPKYGDVWFDDRSSKGFYCLDAFRTEYLAVHGKDARRESLKMSPHQHPCVGMNAQLSRDQGVWSHPHKIFSRLQEAPLCDWKLSRGPPRDESPALGSCEQGSGIEISEFCLDLAEPPRSDSKGAYPSQGHLHSRTPRASNTALHDRAARR